MPYYANAFARSANPTKLGLGIAAALVIVTLIAGCATPVMDPSSRSFQKVGVLSLAGSQLTRVRVGITVFGNEYDRADVSHWKLDQVYAEILAEALRSQARLEAQPVAYATVPDALVSALFDPYERPLSAYDTDRWKAVQEPFKALASANNVEALVVLLPTWELDPFAGSNQIVRGLGVYARGETAKLHLTALVAVISGRTGEIVGEPRRLVMRVSPSGDVDRSIARTPVATMSTAMGEELRQLALRLPVAEAIRQTVPRFLPKQ